MESAPTQFMAEMMIEGTVSVESGLVGLWDTMRTGADTFSMAYPRYYPLGIAVLFHHAHNDCVEMVANMGICVVPILVWLIGLFVKTDSFTQQRVFLFWVIQRQSLKKTHHPTHSPLIERMGIPPKGDTQRNGSEKKMVEKRLYWVMVALLLCIGCGTNGEKGVDAVDENEVVATINDYRITLSEFNTLMKTEAEVNPEFQITMGTREKFLDYLIQKELYIQEAVKLKLDKDEAFIRAIEKYWESTLIRQLLNLKQNEFLDKILITKEEIEAYYQANKTHFGDAPLEAVRPRIVKAIKGQRAEAMSEAWIASMKARADIEINQALLGISK